MALETLETLPAPVTVDELKVHLRIDGDQDDATLAALIDAAVEHFAAATNTTVAATTYRLTIDEFPIGRAILLPKPPLRSVEAIRFVSAIGISTTLASDKYRVDTASKPGRAVLTPGNDWTTGDMAGGRLEIDFTAGHNADDLPHTVRQCMKLMAGAWFELREGAIDRRYDQLPTPFAVSSLIALHAFPNVA